MSFIKKVLHRKKRSSTASDSSSEASYSSAVSNISLKSEQEASSGLGNVDFGLDTILFATEQAQHFMNAWRIPNNIYFLVSAFKAKTTKVFICYMYLLFKNIAGDSMDAEKAYVFFQNSKDSIFGVKEIIAKEGLSGLGKRIEDEAAEGRSDNLKQQGTFDVLNDNMSTIRPVLTAMIGIATLMGFECALTDDKIAKSVKNIESFGRLIRAQNVISQNSQALADTFFETIYSLGGETYYTPKKRHLNEIALNISNMLGELQNLLEKIKTNNFLWVRSQSEKEIFNRYDKLEKQFNSLQNDEQTLYNFHIDMGKIRSYINVLRERRVNLLKSATGRQEPVTVWIAGKTSVGKTELVNRICSRLLIEHGMARYTRTVTDEYTSSYAGQPVFVFDDLAQWVKGAGLSEFHRFKNSNPVDIIGAAIDDKGMPFCSSVILVTSNFMWPNVTDAVNDPASFYRRRDICVVAYNPESNGMQKSKDFFEAHPTRYFLVDPLYGAAKGTPDLTNYNPTHPSTLCEISEEDIYQFVVESEKRNAEIFRKKLIVSKLIDPCPEIFFNQACISKLEDPTIRGSAKTQKKLKLSKQEIKLELETTGGKSFDWFDNDELNEHAAKDLIPVKQLTSARNLAFLLIGPPGVGKTVLCRSLISEGLMAEFNPLENNHVDFAGKSCFIDDITRSRDYLDATIKLLIKFYGGETKIRSLVLVGNDKRKCFSGQDKQIIIRRCYTLRMYFEYNLKGFLRSGLKDFEQYMSEKYPDFAKRQKHIKAEYYLKYNEKEFWSALGINKGTFTSQTVPTALRRYITAEFGAEKIVVTDRAMIVPYFDNWKYTIVFPTCFDSPVLKSNPLKLLHSCSVLKRANDGSVTRSGVYELLTKYKSLRSLLTSTAFGNPAEIVMGFNMERHVVDIDVAIRLVYEDVTFGFATAEDKKEKVLMAFMVNQSLFEESFEILNGAIISDSDLIQKTPENEIYFKILENIGVDKFDNTFDYNTFDFNAMLQSNTVAQVIRLMFASFDMLASTYALYTVLTLDDKQEEEEPTVDESFAPKAAPDLLNKRPVVQVESMVEKNGLVKERPKHLVQVESAVFKEPDDIIKKRRTILVSDEGRAMNPYPADLNIKRRPVQIESKKKIGRVWDVEDDLLSEYNLKRGRVYLHCVSQDAKMSRGVAFDLAQKFKVKIFPKETPSAILFPAGQNQIINLVTKVNYYDKPTIENLSRALEQGMDLIRMNFPDVTVVMASVLGCGLDGLDYSIVRPLLERVAEKSQITIKVHHSRDLQSPELEARTKDYDFAESLTGERGLVLDGVFYTLATVDENIMMLSCRLLVGKFRVIKSDCRIDVESLKSLVGMSFACNRKKTFEETFWNLILVSEARDANGVEQIGILKAIYTIDGVRVPSDISMKYAAHLGHAVAHKQEAMIDANLYAISHTVSPNVVEILGQNYETICFGFMIQGKVGITTYHAFNRFNAKFIRLLTTTKPVYEIKLFRFDNEKDLASFQVVDKTAPSFKDVKRHIITSVELTSYLAISRDSLPVVLRVPYMEGGNWSFDNFWAVLRTQLRQKGSSVMSAVLKQFGCSGVSLPGMCGSIVFLCNAAISKKIVGMHRAGNSVESVFAHLTLEVVEELIFGPDMLQEEAFVQTENGLEHHELEMRKPFFCSEIDGRIDDRFGLPLVAVIPNKLKPPETTRFYRTGIQLPGFDFCEPTIMSLQDSRAQGRSMFAEAVARYAEPQRVKLDQNRIHGAAMEVANYICNVLLSKEGYVRKLRDNIELLNGPPRSEFPSTNRIDGTASLGYPYSKFIGKGIKREVLRMTGDNVWDFRKTGHNSELARQIENHTALLIDDALMGTQHLNPFQPVPKDEVVKMEKSYGENKKNRVFFSTHFPYLLAHRKFFQAAISRIMEHHENFPIKVGITTDRFGWTKMVDQLFEKGDQGFDSDFAAFDARIPLAFLKEIPLIYNEIYRRCDFNGDWKPQDDIARLTLHKSLQGAFIIYSNLILKLDHGQMSGNPGTAIDNSLIVWILYFLIYKDLCLENGFVEDSFEDFMKYVALIIFGDDNAASVAPEIRSWFHLENFIRKAADYGFDATPAKKDGEVIKLQNITELTFLKRGMKYERGMAFCPLDIKSISKMILWIKDSPAYLFDNNALRTSSNISLISEAIDMLWPELALHGEELYNEIRDRILRQAGGLGLQVCPPLFGAALLKLGYD